MQVRAGRPEDGPELERLRRARPYTGSVFYSEADWYSTAVERLHDCLGKLAEHPELRLLVTLEQGRPSGYLLFALDDRHGVTQQLQGFVLDCAVFSFEALQALTKRARKLVTACENLYLVAELLATDQRLQLWFYRCGFRAEQNRAVKLIPRGHQGASHPGYRLRNTRPDDLPFILETHASWSSAYRPANRDTELETLEFHYQVTYAGMDLENPLYFILEEVATGRAAGYIFIQSGFVYGKNPSYYVYDVALAPAFEGRGLSQYMIGAAETLAGREGALLYGDGSLATPLIANWHKQMGYVVESVRMALDCRTC
jgi:GNAT superfamily N-acetyltransferase